MHCNEKQGKHHRTPGESDSYDMGPYDMCHIEIHSVSVMIVPPIAAANGRFGIILKIIFSAAGYKLPYILCH